MNNDNNSNSPQQLKLQAIQRLRREVPAHADQLRAVDARLYDYFAGLANNSSAEPDDPDDRHNLYELLGGIKFLRLLDTYDFDTRKVQKVIRLREGTWRQDGKRWVHVRGGLKQPGNNGDAYYRWEPFQIFILASVFGFKSWINTNVRDYERDLLPTEEVRDGYIWDHRRLCTDFTFFAARKNDKTGLSAFIQVVFFLFEDFNSEIYCCANSLDQSKTLFSRTCEMIRQLDPEGKRIRQNATVCDWRSTYKSVRNSSITPLTGGSKTKDGLIAQLCCADEYGSAPYIKGKSDMAKLIDVIQSSMGSRREPLTFTTTTAGQIQEGPFVDKLKSLHLLLEQELRYGTTDSAGRVIRPTLFADKTLCLCLEPDLWERDEEHLLNSHTVRYKVCPMIGRIVQHSSYDEWVGKVRLEPDKMAEFISKYMNVYKSSSVKEWFRPEQIRVLQVDQTIADCRPEDGWIVFTGMDFSLGDDLHAMSYLTFNYRTRQFFADMDAWMTRHAIEQSPLRPVYERWVAQGWLHECPGETMEPTLPVARIAELKEKCGVDFAFFFYDPFKAAEPINALKAYIHTFGIDPQTCVMPCRQNYATFNPVVLELDYLVKNDPPFIHFSRNPMWVWEAGNMVLDESSDGMGNRKPRQRDRNSKIDNFICVLEGIKGYDLANSSELTPNNAG